VLSDLRMPGVGALQVAREVKRLNPEIKFILMTAFEASMDEFSKVLPSTPVDDFIQKPIKLENLYKVVMSHIGETKDLRKASR
jgi:DNA-binding NtrC family response regulator